MLHLWTLLVSEESRLWSLSPYVTSLSNGRFLKVWVQLVMLTRYWSGWKLSFIQIEMADRGRWRWFGWCQVNRLSVYRKILMHIDIDHVISNWVVIRHITQGMAWVSDWLCQAGFAIGIGCLNGNPSDCNYTWLSTVCSSGVSNHTDIDTICLGKKEAEKWMSICISVTIYSYIEFLFAWSFG